MVNEQLRRQLAAEIEQGLRSEPLSVMQQRIEHLHLTYHDDARMHLRVHRWRLRIALRQHKGLRASLELLALIFAAPVSWVQRYWGAALPSRRL